MTSTSNDTDIAFAIDAERIYYPTAPGRVYTIDLTSLADSDSINLADLAGYLRAATKVVDVGFMLRPQSDYPAGFDPESPTRTTIERWRDAGGSADDLGAMVEQWAEWCDRDSAERDAEDAASSPSRAA